MGCFWERGKFVVVTLSNPLGNEATLQKGVFVSCCNQCRIFERRVCFLPRFDLSALLALYNPRLAFRPLKIYIYPLTIYLDYSYYY